MYKYKYKYKYIIKAYKGIQLITYNLIRNIKRIVVTTSQYILLLTKINFILFYKVINVK